MLKREFVFHFLALCEKVVTRESTSKARQKSEAAQRMYKNLEHPEYMKLPTLQPRKLKLNKEIAHTPVLQRFAHRSNSSSKNDLLYKTTSISTRSSSAQHPNNSRRPV